MKKTPILYLAVIFIILAILASYPIWQTQLSKIMPSKTPDPFGLSRFTQESTGKITIAAEGGTLTLTKDGSAWKVSTGSAAYNASESAVKDLFTALSSAKTGPVVSRNKENQSTFAVSDSAGTIMTLFGSTGEQTIILGAAAPLSGAFYARVNKSDTVYELNSTLKDLAITTLLAWRDKTVVSIDNTILAKIEGIGSNPFTVTKNKDGKWDLSTNGKLTKLEESDISQVISNLHPLIATDFLNEEEKQSFESMKDKHTIQFMDASGKTIATLEAGEQSGEYWVKASNRNDIYKVPITSVTPLLDLVKKAK
jgi:hypothetical protein